MAITNHIRKGLTTHFEMKFSVTTPPNTIVMEPPIFHPHLTPYEHIDTTATGANVIKTVPALNAADVTAYVDGFSSLTIAITSWMV